MHVFQFEQMEQHHLRNREMNMTLEQKAIAWCLSCQTQLLGGETQALLVQIYVFMMCFCVCKVSLNYVPFFSVENIFQKKKKRSLLTVKCLQLIILSPVEGRKGGSAGKKLRGIWKR